MKDVNEILNDAYLDMAEKIERKYKKLPKSFLPIWDIIKQGHSALETSEILRSAFDLYHYCCCAAVEYNCEHNIGIDNAFSTVITAIGIELESEKWYRIMAHHYLQQAERKKREYEYRYYL